MTTLWQKLFGRARTADHAQGLVTVPDGTAVLVIEESVTEDIRRIIRAAGKTGIPRSRLQGELSALGRSIDKHPNPGNLLDAVVKKLIASGEVSQDTEQKTLRWASNPAEDIWQTLL